MTPGLLMGADMGAGGGVPGVRNINVAPAGSLGQFNLSASAYRMAFRFVLDQAETIDRWYCCLCLDGSTGVPAPGHTGYAAGDGGTYTMQIFEVDDGTGLPTATQVTNASETGVNGYARHHALGDNDGTGEFDTLPDNHTLFCAQFASPVSLAADTLYAFVIRNTHASPGTGGGGAEGGNHASPDCVWAAVGQVGPNATNNLDPDATGAVYGLDPRETTMWSDDNGSTWKFGVNIGWYPAGHGDGQMKSWPGQGYRRYPSGVNVGHGYNAMVWPSAAACTVTWLNSPIATTLTEAGGCTAGASLGVVTVLNLTTGVSRTTPSLGAGVVKGTLSSGGLPINIGDNYRISAPGAVERGDAFSYREVFGVGSRTPYKYTSTGTFASYDLPSLFALPHPHYS